MTRKGIDGLTITLFSSPRFCLPWYKTCNIFIPPLRQRSPVNAICGYLKIMGLGLKFEKAKGNITLGAQRTSFTSSISYQQTSLVNIYLCCLTLWIKIIASYGIFCIVTTDKDRLFLTALCIWSVSSSWCLRTWNEILMLLATSSLWVCLKHRFVYMTTFKNVGCLLADWNEVKN